MAAVRFKTVELFQVQRLNCCIQGELSTSEFTDKLSQQIAAAPDKVADFVDKLGNKDSAAGSRSQSSGKGQGDQTKAGEKGK